MKDQPVIIVKKGGQGHGGHHGGAWKVAYADFVTAMMAFFLVMWIVGQSNPMKAGVAGYFRDPGVFERGTGGAAGIMPGAPKGITSPAPTPTTANPWVPSSSASPPRRARRPTPTASRAAARRSGRSPAARHSNGCSTPSAVLPDRKVTGNKT